MSLNPRLLMPPPNFPPRGPRGSMFRVPRPPGPRHWRGGRGGRPYHHPPPHGQRGNFLHPRPFHASKVFHQKQKEKLRNQKRDTASHKSPPREVQNMSTRPWCLLDAQRALNFENEYNESKGKTQIRIDFPDIEVDRESVKCMHPNINKVYFKTPSVTRHCIIQLRPDADVTKVLADLNSKSLPEFDGRYLRASLVETKKEEVKPESIDPYTLYIGNIPQKVNMTFFWEFFPKAIRKDIGHAQKLKNTRYAFVRFSNLKDAIDAFKRVINKEFDSRSVIVRFKRYRALKHVDTPSHDPNDAVDDEEFHYVPENRSTISKTSTDSNEEYTDLEDEYDPEEYDMNEINPPPRQPSLALLRFLKSNDEVEESFKDFDPKKNVTVLPDDVMTVRTTDSLLDLDTPYK